MTTVSKSGTGAHFEQKRSHVVDVLCGVGCIAFALGASGTLVAGTMTTLANGTDILAASVAPTGGTQASESGGGTSTDGGSATPGDNGSDGAAAGVAGDAGDKGDEKSDKKGDAAEDASDDAAVDDTAAEDATGDASTPDADAPAADATDAVEPAPTPEPVVQDPAPAVRTEPVIHLISWGETLSGISARYGVSIDAIAIANQIRDVNLIYAGSALVIPASTA